VIVPRRTAPQARDISPWVRIIIGGVLFIAAAIFILALRHPHTGPSLRDLSFRGDRWWTREARPTPVPSPRLQPAAAPKPIIIRAQRPAPAPTPPPCQLCMERAMRYQRAIETGMGSGSIAANTRGLAQVFNPATRPTPEPPLVIQEQP
jgi:hypothetical protein